MAQVRYAIVFGMKDNADRFLPLGEFYLRNTDLEEAKALFKALPHNLSVGDFVIRIYERYYDKHLEVDMDYQKTEFTLECNQAGLDQIMHHLLNTLA